MTLKEKIENLIKEPTPEPGEYYYNTWKWLWEHEAFYEWRKSAFEEVLKLIDL